MGHPASESRVGKKKKKNDRGVLATKRARLQTEYMGTRRTNITLHGVSMDITEERLGAFRQVAEVEAATGKIGIATGDNVFQVILRRKNYSQVPDILSYQGHNIFVVVEIRCPNCKVSVAAGHISRVCPGKKPTQCTAAGEDSRERIV